VEQPASLIGALNSPHDKSADERQSLETKPISRGTESSNPVPSSGESTANLASAEQARKLRARQSALLLRFDHRHRLGSAAFLLRRLKGVSPAICRSSSRRRSSW
jgi:hypothetical protein